jgi:hypothetical protein
MDKNSKEQIEPLQHRSKLTRLYPNLRESDFQSSSERQSMTGEERPRRNKNYDDIDEDDYLNDNKFIRKSKNHKTKPKVAIPQSIIYDEETIQNEMLKSKKNAALYNERRKQIIESNSDEYLKKKLKKFKTPQNNNNNNLDDDVMYQNEMKTSINSKRKKNINKYDFDDSDF